MVCWRVQRVELRNLLLGGQKVGRLLEIGATGWLSLRAVLQLSHVNSTMAMEMFCYGFLLHTWRFSTSRLGSESFSRLPEAA